MLEINMKELKFDIMEKTGVEVLVSKNKSLQNFKAEITIRDYKNKDIKLFREAVLRYLQTNNFKCFYTGNMPKELTKYNWEMNTIKVVKIKQLLSL